MHLRVDEKRMGGGGGGNLWKELYPLVVIFFALKSNS